MDDCARSASSALPLHRLLHLASATLPVGAFSYSQGLEPAAEAGFVRDAAGAGRWIADLMHGPLTQLDAPLWLRLRRAWEADDAAAVSRWNDVVLASRETAELRAEMAQMGYSLRRLLIDLHAVPESPRRMLQDLDEVSFLAAHALACRLWQLYEAAALEALMWSWLENQVMAAVRIVPLGQTEGQRLLLSLSADIPALAAQAQGLEDDDVGYLAPGLAWLSSRHETQYTRIFRS